MGCKILQKKPNIVHQNEPLMACFSIVSYPFYLLSVTLLSLLLPVSFLLLARLACIQYLLSFPTSFRLESAVLSIFLNTTPNPVHVLVVVVILLTLVHVLTSRITLVSETPGPEFYPCLRVAWVFLAMLQVCAWLGMEAIVKAGFYGREMSIERSMISKLVFFVGLHEAMLHWSRTVVRQVVDDIVYGVAREERVAERVVLAASYGGLWWWRLKGEVESLVVTVEMKRDLLMRIGVADFIGFGLYYLVVTIGVARLVKVAMSISMSLLCKRVVDELNEDHNYISSEENKV